MKEKQSVKDKAVQKAEELSAELKVKVHPLVFQESEGSEEIVGFIKEPSRMVKLALLDKSIMGGFSAASEVLDLVLLKEHSDPRISSERPEDDKVNLGAVMEVYNLVKFSTNTLKKK